ncbi:MAG: plasmid replication protein RepC [Akkermansiaceae bacterium]
MEKTIQSPKHRNPGGRVSSTQLRKSLEDDEGGQGLFSTIDRYHLLRLAERAGKGAGFTPRMLDLLAYYLRFTRESDWEEGSQPIVYQSLSRTALDFGVSERQIQKLENVLFEVGALSWKDSGNHRRYGQRCPTSGKILYAFGVDLSPLANLEEHFIKVIEEKEAHAHQWMEAKRQISFYRRQVKALVAEAMEFASISAEQIQEIEQGYQAIAVQIRTHLSLSRLQDLVQSHQQLFQQAKALLESLLPKQEKAAEDSPTSEEKFAHNKNTNQLPSNKLDTSRAAPNRLARGRKAEDRIPNPTGRPDESPKNERRVGGFQSDLPQHQTPQPSEMVPLNLAKIINASSDRFRDYLPHNSRDLSDHDLVEAADQMRSVLQISKGSWSRACHQMGRVGAAICLMLTDQAALREKNPACIPGAYFNAMINRSKTGDLNLTPAIYALLKRGESHGHS